MALNLIPLQKYEYKRNRFPYTNDFKFIFTESDYKTATIIHYFKDYFNSHDI